MDRNIHWNEPWFQMDQIYGFKSPVPHAGCALWPAEALLP